METIIYLNFVISGLAPRPCFLDLGIPFPVWWWLIAEYLAEIAFKPGKSLAQGVISMHIKSPGLINLIQVKSEE